MGNKILCYLVDRLPWNEKPPHFGVIYDHRFRFFLTVSYATPNVLRVGIATIFSVQGAEFAKPWATEVEKKDGIL